MPIFALPAAFFALAAVPALIAVYWLRTRSRQVVVSSLALWIDQRRSRQGGARIERLQTPLLLLLELIALLALTAAAAAPLILLDNEAPTLYVILDDSYSMRAGETDAPRARALEALREELQLNSANPFAKRRFEPIYIAAGTEPRLVQQSGMLPSGGEWTCEAPYADIPKALALAHALSDQNPLALVLTDEPPETEPNERTKWRAFGRKLPNAAFVNVTRTPSGDRERCLLEIANLSDSTRRTELTIRRLDPENESEGGDETPPPIHQEILAVQPQETRRIVLELPPGAPAVKAELGGDSLQYDNEAVLMPETKPPIRVRMNIQNEALRERLQDALQAAENLQIGNAPNPHIELTDAWTASPLASPPVSPDIWRVVFHAPEDAAAYLGPFVIDQTHPLAQGVRLNGAVWSAGSDETARGLPIVAAGDVPLISEARRPYGGVDLHWNLRIDLSNIQHASAWPILIWNLVEWRVSEMPGLQRANVRLGEQATLRTRPAPPAPDDSPDDDETPTVRIIRPDGETRETPLQTEIHIQTDRTGVYAIETPERRYRIAANALSKNESNLQNKTDGEWGGWDAPSLVERGYRDAAWAFLLAALAALAAHAALARKSSS